MSYGPSQVAIQLDCGVEVALKAFHCSGTYDGILGGAANEINPELIRRAPHQMEELWGRRRTLLIEPRIVSRRLPKWRLHARLESMTFKPDDEADGSQLAVVFFRNQIVSVTIEQMVFEAVKDVNWRVEAESFYFG